MTLNKPHVAVLARHYPLSGGRTVFVKRLIASLSDTFDFTVITKNDKDKHATHESTFNLFYYYLSSFWRLRRLHKKHHVDLVLGTGLSALGGFSYAKLFGIPSLLNVSGVRSFKRQKQASGLKATSNAPSRKARLFNPFTTLPTLFKILSDLLSVTWCTKAIVPSESSKRYIAEGLGHEEKIISVNEGIPPDFTTDSDTAKLAELGQLSKKHVIVLYPIEESFDSPFFTETIRQLDRSHDIILVIGKRIIYRVDTEGQLAETTLRVKDTLPITDVLICTYAGLELHSTTGLEALSSGVTVIPPNLGWWREEFGENNILLLNALTSEEVVAKINHFFANRAHYEEETKRVRQRLLATYDFKRCMDASQKIMTTLIQKTV